MPIDVVIGSKFIMVNKNSKRMLVNKEVTLSCIPMRFTLKKLFEVPGFLHLLKNHVRELNSEQDILSNFIQGNHWKNILRNFSTDKFVCPLFIYFDDFETSNPLGSHSGINKLGGVYFSIPCRPPHMQSKLCNIL